MKTILISVNGGVAEVIDETVPAGFQVEIVDWDNYREAPEVTYARLSDAGKAFIDANKD